MINIIKTKSIFYKKEKESLFITFKFNLDILEDIRALPSRYYHAKIKSWEVPWRYKELVEKLAHKYNQNIENKKSEINFQYNEVNKIDFNSIVLPAFAIKPKVSLFQHQIEAIKYAYIKDNFLLADEMGLGKTASLIHAAILKKNMYNYKHCLVVCGINSLKWNWLEEIEKHSELKAYILGQKIKNNKIKIGTTNDIINDLKKLPPNYFLITNIERLRNKDILKAIIKNIEDELIGIVVLDEAQVIKNSKSIQTKNFIQLHSKCRIAATGTPIMNKPLDLWGILRWLKVEYNNYYKFENYYAVKGGYNNYEIIDYKHLDDLQKKLNSVMIRRLKNDILDLPEKIHTNEYLELLPKQLNIYKECKQSIMNEIDKIKLSPNPLALLIRLRQATGNATILSSNIDVDDCIKFVRLKEILTEKTEMNKKVIVFSNWVDCINKIKETFINFEFAIYTGELNEQEKQDNLSFFRNNPKAHLLGTTKSMGTGLTLTEADTVIFIDDAWNSATKNQAIDRIHRIGQKSTCNIITLICKDTIDERIQNIIYKKSILTDEIVENKSIEKLDKNQLVDALLEGI